MPQESVHASALVANVDVERSTVDVISHSAAAYIQAMLHQAVDLLGDNFKRPQPGEARRTRL